MAAVSEAPPPISAPMSAETALRRGGSMFIFGSSLLVLRCATALKSSLEVTSSWMSLAGYPANNVAFPGRMGPGRPRRATRGQPGKRDPGSRSHEFRTVDPGSPAVSRPPAGEGGRHGALLPAQGHRDVSRHPVRPVDDLDAQLVAAGTKIRVP